MRLRSINRLAAGLVLASLASLPARAHEKNWVAPKERIRGQALVDSTMARHPELLSMTLHGTPPDASEGAHTMFAGSFPERIGNADDPDDIEVITKGITIVDPRWHRTLDRVSKFVVQLPMRDANGENVGLVVYAFKADAPPPQAELAFYKQALELRDGLALQIPNFKSLFELAR